MAQVSREVKRILLQMLPASTRKELLQRHPNLRKAAPHDLSFQFSEYLGDLKVNIDTRFKIERIMWTGQFEPELLHLLGQWVGPDSICFDVGGNVGAVTLAMARAQRGGTGQVHTFEPAPANYARLQANVALNPDLAPRVTLVNRGVGRAAGSLRWTEESDNPGNGSLGTDGDIAVPVITLDSYCAERAIPRIDVMKIDVEGMEFDVLSGAAESLRRWKPKLYFETLSRFKTAGGKGNFEKIESLLVGLGYSLYRLDRDRRLVPADARHLADYTIAMAEPAR